MRGRERRVKKNQEESRRGTKGQGRTQQNRRQEMSHESTKERAEGRKEDKRTTQGHKREVQEKGHDGVGQGTEERTADHQVLGK